MDIVDSFEYYDTDVEKGNTYVYTVKAINGIVTSFCDAYGLGIDY